MIDLTAESLYRLLCVFVRRGRLDQLRIEDINRRMLALGQARFDFKKISSQKARERLTKLFETQ